MKLKAAYVLSFLFYCSVVILSFVVDQNFQAAEVDRGKKKALEVCQF